MLMTAMDADRARLRDFGSFRLNLTRGGASVPSWFAFVRPDALMSTFDGGRSELTPDDLQYLQQCKSPIRQNSYVSGRFAARRAIAGYLNRGSAQRIDISPGVFNHPVVRCAAAETPDVTISHTQDLAVAIAYDRSHILGIDVEQVNPSKTKFLLGILSPAEQELLGHIPLNDDAAVTLAWTMRESVSKALRCGLTVPTAILEISRMAVAEDGAVVCEFMNLGQYKCHSWVLGPVALSIALPKKSDLIFRPADVLLQPQANPFALRSISNASTTYAPCLAASEAASRNGLSFASE